MGKGDLMATIIETLVSAFYIIKIVRRIVNITLGSYARVDW